MDGRTSRRYELDAIWQACRAETPLKPQASTGKLVRLLSDVLDGDYVDFSEPGAVVFFLLDVSAIPLQGMDLNILAVMHPPKDDGESRELQALLSDFCRTLNTHGIYFVICLGKDTDVPRATAALGGEKVVILRSDIERLLRSPRPEGVFFEVVSRQLPVVRLCPFNCTSAARGGLFRGRQAELARLTGTADKQYVVCGARRIGKTSLLRRAYSMLRRRRGSERNVFFFDGRMWHSAAQCFIDVARELDRSVDPARVLSPDVFVRLLKDRSEALGTCLVLFLDEMDEVLEADRSSGWPLLHAFRHATAMGWVRIVMAGFRALRKIRVDNSFRHLRDNDAWENPFVDAVDVMELSPLAEDDAAALVWDAFRAVGIQLENRTRLTKAIMDETRCYPFLIHFFGERLFHLAMPRSPCKVLEADVRVVRESAEYRSFMQERFLENTLSHGSVVLPERLCAFLLARETSLGGSWNVATFYQRADAVHHLTVDEIVEALANLCKAALFQQTGDHYSFVFPVHREIITNAFPDVQSLRGT